MQNTNDCDLPFEIEIIDGEAAKKAYQGAVDAVTLLISIAMVSFVLVVLQ